MRVHEPSSNGEQGAIPSAELLIRDTAHRAVSPWRTLADLDASVGEDAPRSAALIIGALLAAGSHLEVRRFTAKRACGPKFDGLVHAVLVEAERSIPAACDRASLGGPRSTTSDTTCRGIA